MAGVGARLNDWIARRVAEYGFEDGADFYSILSKTRGRPRQDYLLTIDTAKELAMVERTEIGRATRRQCHHPDVFCCALMNAQQMGFYAPAQIVRDARNHGVEVLPVDINESRWDCTLEDRGGKYLAVRLGFRCVRGLSNLHGAMIVGARGEGAFRSIEDVWQRSGASAAAIELLSDADAFLCLDKDRRRALWSVRGLGASPLPLFAAADAREGYSPETPEAMVTLKPLSAGREVVEDY